MQSSFPELRRMLRSRWLPVEVLDEEDASADCLARAEAVGDLVKLPTTLSALDVGRDGAFGLHPMDLMLTHSSGQDTSILEDMEECFEFAAVRDAAGAQALANALEARPTDDRWPFRSWIEDALAKGQTLLAVDEPQTGRRAGFLAYRRRATVHAHPDDTVELDYCLTPECIYVAPDCRGLRLASALRRAVMEDVASDVERIAHLTRTPRFRKLGDVTVTFRVSGDAYSPEGEAFLAAATANIEEFVEHNLADDEREQLGCTVVEPDYSM